MNLEFIEAEQRRLAGDHIRERRDRVVHLRMLTLDLMEAPVGLLHEIVEMDALLAGHLGCGEEQIHQHGFAPPDLADDIKPAGVVLDLIHRLTPQQPAEPAIGGLLGVGVIAAQLGPKVLQMLHRRRLGGVISQLARGEAGAIGGHHARFLRTCHAARIAPAPERRNKPAPHDGLHGPRGAPT